MRTLTLSSFLKIIAPVFLCVGGLHLWLGLQADVLLGARLPVEVVSDPALDSQNRFYGVAFSLYGVLLLICAANLAKYQTILRAVLWVFFAAGLARLVSVAIYGLPPLPVSVLLGSELLLPPAILFWLHRAIGRT
jgi:hypothetical protein